MTDSDRYDGNGQPTAGLSVWWPTPSSVDRSFSPAQLAYSEQVHGPLRRAAIFLLVSRAALLAAAVIVVGMLAQTGPVVDLGFVAQLGIGAGLSIVALRLPPILTDTWIEYRHRPAIEGGAVTPRWYFARTLVLLNFLYGCVLFGAAWFAYWLSAQAVALWTIAAIGALALASIVGAARSSIADPALPRQGQPDDGEAELDTSKLVRLAVPLMEHFGLSDSVEVSTDDRNVLGCNAYSTRSRGRGRIVVGQQLANEPQPIVSFVIAHELAHLVNRHVSVQKAVAFALNCLGIVLFFLVSKVDRFWGALSLDGSSDPLGLPVVVSLASVFLGVSALVKNWLGRAHERIADRDAAGAVGVLEPHHSQRLHARGGADLAPPWWLRVFSPHPSPSERVEYLARLRR